MLGGAPPGPYAQKGEQLVELVLVVVALGQPAQPLDDQHRQALGRRASPGRRRTP